MTCSSKAEKTAHHQSLHDLLASGAQLLRDAGVENPRREARLLLQHALGITPEALLGLSPREEVATEPFLGWVARRARHEPFAYITGSKGFWSLDLAVSTASLVPRGDTETLITALLDACPDRTAPLSFLDLGTGSGCILLAALAEYRQAWGIGVDVNPAAASLAHANARRCNMADRALVMAARWGDALAPQTRFDVVFSNPPYIPTPDLDGLMEEVRAHEPVRALDGGSDGLDAYRDLCARLPLLLRDDGVGIFEIGVGQEQALRDIAAQNGLGVVRVLADLAGIARCVVLR
ncbi:peptide chain release factor N(5)-glutamine methyltransferase [Acetobacter fabarum]|uniref:peptide chain release factor N(5)-glutamine methyltransferase n=1 Tax=Acetobacter fabarum TaxID=483199 RepID=A0A269Y2N7_9PROT|nr:peptide chain release factor N(5)-glutamine methyltransferase [Acetobacter fabarum]PAK79690.1 protein-(glutamine-N5) methyltransferase, release factor-specific [Acetobacter fabarum]PEN28990.1 protein-(glutamine-N5) methyltransferase, release factor-specific [Acetobacter fabarum]